MQSESEVPQGGAGQEPPGPATAGVQRAAGATVDTPVATPVPARALVTRRLFILGGFWSIIGLALVGLLGPSLDFAWPRKVAGAATKVFVSPDRIPKQGEEPVVIPEGRFFLVNLKAGVTPNGEQAEAGLLALWRRCPHLGCTVTWRADFTFLGRTGWFRCPCHGSTYTKEGGVLVAGPSPRPLDRFPVEVKEDGSIVVTTGVSAAEKGSPENPSKTVEYNA